MGSSYIVSLVLRVSLAKVWNMVNNMQIIGKLPLFNIYVPANVIALFKFIDDIASFKIIPTDAVVNSIMG